jgi:hypothetical protein
MFSFINKMFKLVITLKTRAGWSNHSITRSEKDLYSDPPNTEPRSVFRFDLMPVPDIRILERSKTGHSCPVASLDRFIKKRAIKYILFMPKRSRLVRKYPVRISNGKNKMAATILKPDPNPDFERSGLA